MTHCRWTIIVHGGYSVDMLELTYCVAVHPRRLLACLCCILELRTAFHTHGPCDCPRQLRVTHECACMYAGGIRCAYVRYICLIISLYVHVWCGCVLIQLHALNCWRTCCSTATCLIILSLAAIHIAQLLDYSSYDV